MDGIDLFRSVVIQGQVLQGVTAVSGGYVRLLDNGGDFIAEVPLSATGQFRFFSREGNHTLKAMIPGATLEKQVQAVLGAPVDVILKLGES